MKHTLQTRTPVFTDGPDGPEFYAAPYGLEDVRRLVVRIHRTLLQTPDIDAHALWLAHGEWRTQKGADLKRDLYKPLRRLANETFADLRARFPLDSVERAVWIMRPGRETVLDADAIIALRRCVDTMTSPDGVAALASIEKIAAMNCSICSPARRR